MSEFHENQQERIPEATAASTRVTVSKGKPPRRGGCLTWLLTVVLAALVGAGSTLGALGYLGAQPGSWFGAKSSTPSVSAPQAPKARTQSSDMSIADIAERVVPTVVGINNYGAVSDIFGRESTARRGTGSGVIIRKDGTIVTNFHVIAGATKLTVTLADGKTQDASVIGFDRSSDIAVIKMKGDNLPAVEIGDSSALRVGDLAVAVGNPLGEKFSQTVTDGIISGINRKIEIGSQRFSLIQTNAAINSGNSGGALVNGQGQLIGINSVKIQAEGVEGLGFAIPINDVMSIVKEIEENGGKTKERPFIGISGYSLTPEIAQQVGAPVDSGLLVMQIVKDSPADQAGIQPGDIIVEVNGKKAKTFEDLAAQLDQMKIGDHLNMTLLRGAESLKVQVTLAANTDTSIPQ